jgi:hypothetical protein
MSTYSYIEDFEDRVSTWVIGRYRKVRSPRLHELLQALGLELQEVEDTLLDLLVTRFLDGASDHQLDVLGRIVGERRDGLDDGTYRRFIAARRLIRASGGERWRLLQIVQMLTGSEDVRWWGAPPASFVITYQLPAALSYRARVFARLEEATASGVRPQLVELVDGAFGWVGGTHVTEDWSGDWAILIQH